MASDGDVRHSSGWAAAEDRPALTSCSIFRCNVAAIEERVREVKRSRMSRLPRSTGGQLGIRSARITSGLRTG